MNELSIEEKAKAYDHAMKVIEKYKDARIMFTQDLKEEMFPELKEELEDEKIRKEMIFYFQEEIPQCSIQEHADKMKKFIAWLEKQNSLMKCLQIANARIGELIEENYYLKEKQGKQKTADKVEPKFKHGNRVRNKKSGLEQTLGSCIEDVYEGAFPFRIKDQDDWELVEQKPIEWSEDDEKMFESTIKHLKKSTYSAFRPYIKKDVDWLKSLKERMKGK